MRYALSAAAGIFFLVTLLQGVGPFPILERQDVLAYGIAGWVALTASSIVTRLDTLQEKLDGLEKGSPAQGSYQQRREPAREEGKQTTVLFGHWHRTFPAPLCREGTTCAHRDPRSTS